MSNPLDTVLALTGEVISLNGRQMIKVCHGRYLVGYFYDTEDLERGLKRKGLNVADLQIKES